MTHQEDDGQISSSIFDIGIKRITIVLLLIVNLNRIQIIHIIIDIV